MDPMKLLGPLFLLLLLGAPASARAQVFTDTPQCVSVHNGTDHEVLGHVETDEYRDDTGNLSWHRSNFRLQANETEQACSTGPFFPGQQLRVVLKTIIPLYTCRTPTNTTVNITERDGPGGITELVADCPAENPKQAP